MLLPPKYFDIMLIDFCLLPSFLSDDLFCAVLCVLSRSNFGASNGVCDTVMMLTEG